MILIWFFPVLLLAVLGAWIASACKARSVRAVPAGLNVALAALCLAYLLALAGVSADPWFDDNGVPEFIEWRFRWGWAAAYANLLAIPALLVAFGLRAMLRGWRAVRAARADKKARRSEDRRAR